MTRRLILVLTLVVALFGTVVANATADVEAQVGLEIRLPLPALPIGPGPLYPLDSYGPRADDNAVLRWSEQALAAIRALKTGPTINARALAIVHTAMYDAWAAYDPTAVGTRLGGSLRRPAAERTDAYKSQAISYAGYRALLNLFPARSADFRALMTAMGYDPDDASTDPASPTGVGNQAAAAVLAFRATDGSNQAEVTPTPSATAGQHPRPGQQPVPLAAAAPPQRQRRHHRPEVPDPALGRRHPVRDQLARPVPPAGADPADPAAAGPGDHRHPAASATLTDLTKIKAEYWADGPASETPPGHWLLFAGAVCRARGYSLDQTAKLTFALANAELDASIAAWNSKLRWDYVRPITAVRVRMKGKLVLAWAGPYKGTRLIKGETWHPYQAATFPTPPFAEYVSGHSTFSGAGAKVLQQFTGSDLFGARVTVRPGTSFIEPGATPLLPTVLIWPTFSSARDEGRLAVSVASTFPTPTSTAAPSARRSASRPGRGPRPSSTARRAASPPPVRLAAAARSAPPPGWRPRGDAVTGGCNWPCRDGRRSSSPAW